MPSLRHIKSIARFVLVWFVLSIGAAIASPIVKPQALELICSGTGVMTVQVKTDEGAKKVLSHTLDCPLCVTHSAPPPPLASLTAAPIEPLAYVMQSIPAALMASLTAIPPPARGPPVIS